MTTVCEWMSERLHRAAGLTLGAAALACALGGVLPQSVRAADTPVAAAAPVKPLMWVIRGADSTIYLFGTIHVMTDDVKWLTPDLRQKFESADDLWLEIPDLDNTVALMQAAQKYTVNPANDMTRGLTADEVKRIDELTAPYGLSAERMQGMKKWAVGLFITTQRIAALGYNPRIGVDVTLLDGARYLDKSVHGFETVDTQMQALLPANDAEDIASLREALKDADTMPKELPPLLGAWAHGDEAAMTRDLVVKMKQEDPTGYQRMLVARNAAWEPQIETILKGKGTVFIAVGTAHLIGPDSVIAMLKAHGITAEKVN